MSQHSLDRTEELVTKKSLESNFANPKLVAIASAAEIRSARSIRKGILLEILAWFVAYVGFLIFLNLPTSMAPFGGLPPRLIKP
jgi:hypothetical protein